jgi:biopolymer transport protein ExbB
MNVLQILLQITTDTPVVETAETAAEGITLAELLLKGGVIMIPIVLLFIITIYLFVERFLYLRSVIKQSRDFGPSIKKYLEQGDLKMARMYADQQESATGQIIRSGLDYVGRPFKEIESVMESMTNIKVAEMEKNLGYLGIIAGVAPMLGFIGTIMGIIHIFYDISLSDNISIGIIASGLYEKMITSGSGLVVGVIAYCSYHLLHQKIQRFTLQIQKDVFEFMKALLIPQP